MLVLRNQSTKYPQDVDKMYYFMVPTTWIRRAWPLLSGQTNAPTVEQVGRIPVSELCEGSVTQGQLPVSEDEGEKEENKQETTAASASQPASQENPPLRTADVETQKSRMLLELSTKTTATPATASNGRNGSNSLRSNLRHGADYCVLGPNTWTMVKRRFGSDMILKRPIRRDDRTLSIVIGPQENLQIPPEGHFGYGNLFCNNAPVGNVSDDDDETDLVSCIHLTFVLTVYLCYMHTHISSMYSSRT